MSESEGSFYSFKHAPTFPILPQPLSEWGEGLGVIVNNGINLIYFHALILVIVLHMKELLSQLQFQPFE